PEWKPEGGIGSRIERRPASPVHSAALRLPSVQAIGGLRRDISDQPMVTIERYWLGGWLRSEHPGPGKRTAKRDCDVGLGSSAAGPAARAHPQFRARETAREL